ncbi:hypothetical protein [Antrihabitans spumae]|uniref:Uncharacterized protein n=1 Tax=Antrihabitans spumae TaxID=3373370 RepID=A0ABW7KIU2_9NOCA
MPKVVIWDLDGTLWEGVIDAGSTGAVKRGVALIPQLAARGIVNTICSNNTADIARDVLDGLGLLRYVVFEQIDWIDKRRLVARIVEFFDVSRAAILLVDDDPRVRATVVAEFGICAASPYDIDRIDVAGWGRPDDGLTRLGHYRVLARRWEARVAHGADGPLSPIEFLRTSRIRVEAVDVRSNADRIADLSRRSNQLNLTNSRLTVDDVLSLATSDVHDCIAVTVQDRFGDYGLCGFIAYHVGHRRLEHFFWSCRVLNQGVVEHFAADLAVRHDCKLRHGALRDFGVPVDWIQAGEGVAHFRHSVPAPGAAKVLLVGGCDLDIVAAFIDENFAIDVHGLDEAEGVQQYGHSSLGLLVARARTTDREFESSAAALPWVGTVSDVRTWSGYDAVVVSLWVDYCSITVRRRDDSDGISVPSYKVLDDNLTDWEWQHWVGSTVTRSAFRLEYMHGPPVAVGAVVESIRDLVAALPVGVKLIVVNAPEIERDDTYSWGENQRARNVELNRAIRDLAAVTPGLGVVDVGRLVTTEDDLHEPGESTGFHYRRDVYKEIASEVVRGLSVSHRFV